MSPLYYLPAPRKALNFGVNSGYCIVSIEDINRINFDYTVHVTNIHFKRSQKIPTTLLIDISNGRDAVGEKVSLNILNYFDKDGCASTKAPKLYLCNGMPLNLVCPPVWRKTAHA